VRECVHLFFFTCAGNLDSPLHFLSSHAVGSMFDPPKLTAFFFFHLKINQFMFLKIFKGQENDN
jgi:hypothetical protein